MRLPASIYSAGIRFAFSYFTARNAFDLPIPAARSIAFGLPATDAPSGPRNGFPAK